MARQDGTSDRLMHLERTLSRLNGQLREMQGELQRAKGQSRTERFWRSFMSPDAVFMSAVCNRRIRPNTKVTRDHASNHAS
jgi:hypothetical protein